MTFSPVTGRRFMPPFVVLICLAVLSLGLATATAAASITVTTSADGIVDDDECTLREAIQNANHDDESGDDACDAGSGADTILLQDESYTLADSGANENANATGDLDVTSDITIKPADSQDEPTIDGGGSPTTFACDGTDGAQTSDRVLHVTSGTLTLEDLVVRQGVLETASGPSMGGGVLIEGGHLALTRSVVEDNAVCTGPTLDSSSFGGGVAVISSGTVAFVDSTVADNRAIATGDTQGAHAQGGGAWLGGGSFTIDGSTIDNNETVVPDSGTNITSTGGGIWVKASGSIVNSTISGNQASDGGGIYFTTSTGVSLSLQHATISDNDEAGLVTTGPDGNNSKVQAHWTILADNGGDQCDLGDSEHFDSLDFNLTSDDSCGLDQPADIENGESALARLGANGGETETQLPGAGSDAIDAIPATQCSLTVDQRDKARPTNGACDIGAVELQSGDPGGPPAGSPTPTPSGSTSPTATPSASPTEAPAACEDGSDNDEDGDTDFPADAGCSSATDRTEGSEGTGGGGGGGGVKERRIRASMTLEWLPGADKFKGKVSSKEGTCRKHRLVKLFRIDAGPNTFIGKDRTNDRGHFVVPADGPDFGRYMAKAPKKTRTQGSLKLVCLPAKSEPVQT